MSARALVAWINNLTVGTLREADDLWAFEYHTDWHAAPDAFALSPHLPLGPAPIRDGAGVRPVQWYFDNLLPEEAQRTLLAKDAQLDQADAFSLLGYYGAESAGSLTLLPPGETPVPEMGVRALADDALSARICRLPREPLAKGALKRMSLAGAQHKLAVCLTPGGLGEPMGSTPSTHILKPDHPDSDYSHSVVNEWFVMHLARRLGLAVPDVERRYVPEPVYLIARFDRELVDGTWRRRHTIDACQLLGLARGHKYSSSRVDTLAKTASLCRRPLEVRSRLFSWLVFNLLTGNGDAHMKNLSFMVGEGGIILSPHYDLLSTACYDTRAFDKTGWPLETGLSWPIGDAQRFSDVTRAQLLEAGGTLSVTPSAAKRLLDQQCTRIADTAQAVYGEFEAENAAMVEWCPNLAPRLAGESRALRTIVHVIIPDMVQRLAPQVIRRR